MTANGTVNTRIVCVAVCCHHCSAMLLPHLAKHDERGEWRCLDRRGCVTRMRTLGRTPTHRDDEAARCQDYRRRAKGGAR